MSIQGITKLSHLVGCTIEQPSTVPPRRGVVLAAFVASCGAVVTVLESDGIVFEVSVTGIQVLSRPEQVTA